MHSRASSWNSVIEYTLRGLRFSFYEWQITFFSSFFPEIILLFYLSDRFYTPEPSRVLRRKVKSHHFVGIWTVGCSWIIPHKKPSIGPSMHATHSSVGSSYTWLSGITCRRVCVCAVAWARIWTIVVSVVAWRRSICAGGIWTVTLVVGENARFQLIGRRAVVWQPAVANTIVVHQSFFAHTHLRAEHWACKRLGYQMEARWPHAFVRAPIDNEIARAVCCRVWGDDNLAECHYWMERMRQFRDIFIGYVTKRGGTKNSLCNLIHLHVLGGNFCGYHEEDGYLRLQMAIEAIAPIITLIPNIFVHSWWADADDLEATLNAHVELIRASNRRPHIYNRLSASTGYSIKCILYLFILWRHITFVEKHIHSHGTATWILRICPCQALFSSANKLNPHHICLMSVHISARHNQMSRLFSCWLNVGAVLIAEMGELVHCELARFEATTKLQKIRNNRQFEGKMIGKWLFSSSTSSE